MKRIFSTGLIIIVSSGCLLSRLVGAEDAPLKEDRRTMTVEGTGKLMAPPDIAHLSVGVSLDGKDSESVAAEVRRKTRTLLDAAKAQGIADKDLQTQSYTIQPNWEYLNGKTRKIGYTVSNQVVVTVRDLSKIGKVLSALVEAGATNMTGPDFDFDNSQTLERKALALAMEDAKAKAGILAQAADAKLGPALTINQSGINWPSPSPQRPLMAMRAMAAQAAEEPVATGEQSVTAVINVTFELR